MNPTVKQWWRKYKHSVVGILVCTALLLGLLLVLLAVKRAQDVRHRATQVDGTVHVELRPGSSNIAAGQEVSLDIIASSLDATQIDAFQVFLTATGSAVPELTFEPAQIPGMFPAGLVDEETEENVYILPTESGTKIQFLQIGPVQGSSIVPFTPQGSEVKLGTIRFTAPHTGQLVLMFDSQTKIIPHNIDGDLAAPAETFTYTFGQEHRKITSIRIHPGTIEYSFTPGGKVAPLSLSALAYDQFGQPIHAGVQYEWGVSSDGSLGQLIFSGANSKIARFIHSGNEGSGDLWVRANFVGENILEGITQSIPIVFTAHPATTEDDLFFTVASHQDTSVSFKDAITHQTVPAAQLVIGKQYHATITATINNLVKDAQQGTIPSHTNVAVSLIYNGVHQNSANFSYGILYQNVEGYTVTLSTAVPFVATANNVFVLSIDRLNQIQEPNENNNSLARTYSAISANSQFSSFSIRTSVLGVTQDRGPITAKVQVGALGNTTPIVSRMIPLVYEDGSYMGVLSADNALVFPDKIWVTVKGHKHLQRLFSGLQLTQNNQTLDLTSKPLQPGDLPIQDGTIDLEDINTMLSIFAKPEQTVSDINTGDLNYDGVVNAADLALLLVTLSFKPDEAIP